MGTNVLTDVSNILKKVIAPQVQDLLFYETILLSQFKKNSGVTFMGNNNFYISLRTQPYRSYSVAEDASIPTSNPAYGQATIPCKWTFISTNISDQVLEATKTDKGALKNRLKEMPIEMKKDLGHEINVMLHGYGSGQLALVNGTTGAQSVITVDTPGTDNLSPGMSIEINGDAATILTVDSSTQITLTGAITVADNEVITKASDAEMMGIIGSIDDGDYVATFQNISHSLPYWKAYCDDDAEVLDEADVRKAVVKAKKYARGKLFAVTGEDLFLKYGDLLTGLRRSADLKEKLVDWDIGGLEITPGVGLFLDYDTWAGFVHIIDASSFTMCQLADVAFIEGTNGVLDKMVGKANYEATLKYYGNLACKDVRANARLSAKTT